MKYLAILALLPAFAVGQELVEVNNPILGKYTPEEIGLVWTQGKEPQFVVTQEDSLMFLTRNDTHVEVGEVYTFVLPGLPKVTGEVKAKVQWLGQSWYHVITVDSLHE